MRENSSETVGETLEFSVPVDDGGQIIKVEVKDQGIECYGPSSVEVSIDQP